MALLESRARPRYRRSNGLGCRGRHSGRSGRVTWRFCLESCSLSRFEWSLAWVAWLFVRQLPKKDSICPSANLWHLRFLFGSSRFSWLALANLALEFFSVKAKASSDPDYQSDFSCFSYLFVFGRQIFCSSTYSSS